MNLKVLLPTEILIEQEVTKIVAEAGNGLFCILPRHVDFVAALVPGILAFTTSAGEENFLAVDEGILVKCGSQVLVSTLNAVQNNDLATLQETIAKKFLFLDEQEKQTRSSLAKFEREIIRSFQQLMISS